MSFREDIVIKKTKYDLQKAEERAHILIGLSVSVENLDKIKNFTDRGASGSSSIEEITNSVDVLLTCLPNVETSKELFMGKDGIFEYANSNQVLVDHSTVDVKTSKECFDSASSKGLNFLDAPISGGPGGAADGTLMTPHIDSIAKTGIAFNNGYAASAACSPSRAAILTGRYSTRFGFDFTPYPKTATRLLNIIAVSYTHLTLPTKRIV